MTQPHPKAIEAQQRAAARSAERATMKGQLKAYRAMKFKFLHLKDTTIAYKVDRRSVIRVANTLRHPHDHNDPLKAKLIAAQRLENGMCITLRMPSTSNPFLQLNAKGFIASTFFHIS